MKKFFRSPAASVILFLIAAGMLLFSSIGGTMAVLNIASYDYRAEIVLDEINVGLAERNEGEASFRDISFGRPEELSEGVLLTKLIPEGKTFTLGTSYVEELAVTNPGAINEYVRVSVYRYWERDGQKDLSLDPSLIDLHFVTGNGWEIDENATTDERTVLYYTGGQVSAQGGITTPFTDTLTISEKAGASEYVGAAFRIEAMVDGVQNHNAEAAITSSWGHTYPGMTY